MQISHLCVISQLHNTLQWVSLVRKQPLGDKDGEFEDTQSVRETKATWPGVQIR